MMISIDLTSLVMLVAIVFLVWVMVDMMKARKEKRSPVIVRDVDVYDYPSWVSGWEWWPWNWSTRPWISGSGWGSGWGSGSGNVWFGPGKPCKGWHCDGGHKTGPHPPINITQNNNVPVPPSEQASQANPIQTLPIQDVPVQPPTAQQDIQVALAPTPAAIQPDVSNIGTQTEATSTEAYAPTTQTA